jgi:ABC-2 type transport system permease protein
MSPKRTAAIVLRQFYLLRGSPVRILPMLGWVAIDIVLWGFISRYLNTVASAGFNFVPALVGAVLLWDFLVRVMQGVTTALFEDVWSRNFLNIFATPLSISEYVSGLVITSTAMSLVGLVVMFALAIASSIRYRRCRAGCNIRRDSCRRRTCSRPCATWSRAVRFRCRR